jgi:hypothetical protein
MNERWGPARFIDLFFQGSPGSFTVSLVLSAGLLALWALVVSRLGDVGPLQAGEMPTTRAAGALETPSGAPPTSPGD